MGYVNALPFQGELKNNSKQKKNKSNLFLLSFIEEMIAIRITVNFCVKTLKCFQEKDKIIIFEFLFKFCVVQYKTNILLDWKEKNKISSPV